MVQDPSLENDPSQVKTKSYHADPRSKEQRYQPEAEADDDRCLDVCGEYLEEEGVDAAEAALKRDGLDACVETCVQDQVLGYHEIKLGNSFVPFEYDLTPEGFRSSNGQYLSEILENSNGLEREYIENLLEIERKILSGETTQAFLVSREPGSNTPVIYSYTVDPENKNKIRANTIIMWGGETELANYLGVLGKQTGINTADLYDGAVVTQDSENVISDQEMFQAGYEALSQNATVKVQGGDPFRDQIAQQKETVATLRSAYKQYLEGAGSEQEQLERVKKLATLHADAVSEIMEILNIGSKDLPASFDKADMLDRISLLVEGLQNPRSPAVEKIETGRVKSAFSEKMGFATSPHVASPHSSFRDVGSRSASTRVTSPVGAFSKGASEPPRGLASDSASSRAVTSGQNAVGLARGRSSSAHGSRMGMSSPGVRRTNGAAFTRPSKPLGLRGRDRFLTEGVPRGQRVAVKPDLPPEEDSRESALDKELKQRLQRDIEVPEAHKTSEMTEQIEGDEQLMTEGANDLVVDPVEDLQLLSEELALDDDIEETDQVALEPIELEEEQELILEEDVDEEFLIEASASEQQQEQAQDVTIAEPVAVNSGSIDFEQSDELAEIESLFEEELQIEEEELLDAEEVEERVAPEVRDTEEVFLDDGVEESIEQTVGLDEEEAEDDSLLADIEAEELVTQEELASEDHSVIEEDLLITEPTAEDVIETPTAADEIAFLESIDEGAYSDEIVFEAEPGLESADQQEEQLADRVEESITQAFEESIVVEEEMVVDALSEEDDLELESQAEQLEDPLEEEPDIETPSSPRLADRVEQVPPSIQYREARIRLLRQLHELALEQELELEEFMKKHRRYKKKELELDFLIYRLLFELDISDEFREYLMQEVGFSDLELEELLELLLHDQQHLGLSSALVQRFRSFRLGKGSQKHEPLFDKTLMQ